jgi:hypothetical protein
MDTPSDKINWQQGLFSFSKRIISLVKSKFYLHGSDISGVSSFKLEDN